MKHSATFALAFMLAAAGPHLRDASAQQTEDASAGFAVSRIEPPFAWNRTDGYAPPDFEAFFPDDPAAGRQLDLFLEGGLPLTDPADRLALIRRGLRHMTHHRTTLLGRVGNEFVWNQDPQDPRAIELLYHASASPDGGVAHYALYHGPTVVSGRTPNLVRMLMEQYHVFDREIQGRIAWGMRRYGDREHTRRLMENLLDDHERLPDATIAAAIDTYQAVFDEPPPDIERFAHVGTWVIAFHRNDLSAEHPRATRILRETLDHGEQRGLRLVDFVTRVDGDHETAVALVQGLASRTDLVTDLSDRKHHHIDFNELLSPRLLQEWRLREFARHLPGGLPSHALPAYTRPPADGTYAHRADRFVAPDFARFFADDATAGAELDQVYAARESIDLTDRELLDLFRRGVRRSAHKPNVMFGWISGALGWPRDPLLTEIFYQALDPVAPPEFRKAGVYYGFGLGTSKTSNILEALFHVYMAPPFDRTTNRNHRSRILWGVRDHEDDKHTLATHFAAALRAHASLSDEALLQADAAYRELTGTAPANAAEYANRGLFLVMCQAPSSLSLAEAKEQITRRLGDSQHVVDTGFVDHDGRAGVLVLVRGTVGSDWLIEELQREPAMTIYFADLLTRELIEQADDDLLQGFEKHLPASQPAIHP